MNPNPSIETAEPISDTTCVYTDIGALAGGIVRWLVSRQMPSGGIRGEGDVESSSDHYAHSFAALAIALLAESERSPQLWEQAERAAYYTISLPARARSVQEFNSLALLMLTGVARASSIASSKLHSTLEKLIKDPSFLYDGDRQVSNNWLAMRAVCFLIRANLTEDEQSRRRGESLLRETLDWQLRDGVFIDFPRRPRGEFATPLTYHAKMCAMLALAADYTQLDDVLPALELGLRALVGVMSPQGECLFYGRSCNSLFGMAAVYFALQVAANRRIPGSEWDSAAQRIGSRLAHLKEPDGHLRLTPAGNEAERPGWDVYYHSEVYNAYAAALLLSAPNVSPEAINHTLDDRTAAEHECFNLPDAGLMAVRGPQFFVTLSTKGQCVLDGSSLFCDARYSGMQPMLVEVGGRVQIPEPPMWWRGPSTKGKAVSPARIGYVPYIKLAGDEFCARTFEDVLLSGGDGWHGVYGKGDAVSLSLPNRITRLLRRVRGKVTGKGDLAFTASTLPNLVILRAIIVFPRIRALLFVDGYDGNWPRNAIWSGPNARVASGAETVVRDVLGAKPLLSENSLPTSRGTANYFSAGPIEGPPTGCVSAITCAPDGVNIAVDAKRHVVCIRTDETHICLNLWTGQIEEMAR